jgi:tetratricopeptide (TPR) repeat protein
MPEPYAIWLTPMAGYRWFNPSDRLPSTGDVPRSTPGCRQWLGCVALSEPGRVDGRPTSGGANNDIHGTVTGSVVQAGSVGQIHYHMHDYQEHERGADPVVPAQLPRSPRFFTSRERELADLFRWQSTGEEQPPLIVISGPAGVGKTTLALHWLRRARDRFPDGQLYVDLGGFSAGDPVDPADVLEWFLAALGVPARRVPADLAARAALYRSVTQGRAVAVLLDNAASAAQVRPLVPVGRDSVVAVTSRWRLSGLAVDGARFIDVDPLDMASSVDLLRTFVDHDRADAEPDAVRDLAGLCGGLPIALSVVGARLSTRPRRTVAREVADLRAQPHRLTALSVAGEPSVGMVFDLSYDSLPKLAGRLYRVAALHPGPHFGVPVLSAALNQSSDDVEGEAGLLAEAHLFAEVADTRFGFHDLVRLHARERAEQTDEPADRDRSVRRMVEWYLNTAVAADLLVHPLRDRLGPRYADVADREDLFGTDDQALAWLEVERDNLFAATLDADWRGWDDLVWQFCEALWGMFLHARRYDGWIVLHRVGIAAAQRCADPRVEARLRAQLGFAYAKVGRFHEAMIENEIGLALATAAGDDRGRATALSQLGRAARESGDLDAAMDYYRAARDLQADLGIERGVALCCRRIGQVLLTTGRAEEAIPELRRAESIMAALGDHTQHARSLMFLARAQVEAGHHDEAEAALHTGLQSMRRLGSSYYQAEILAELGELTARRGDVTQARRLLNEALALYDAVQDPAADRIRTRLARMPSSPS